MNQHIDSTHLKVLALLILSWLVFSSANAVERLIWDKHPLRLTLPVGKERLVTFPQSVKVDVPDSIAEKLTTQSLNGTVYWTANTPFKTTRFKVKSTHGNQLYLIDLSATKDSDTTDVEIQLPTVNAAADQADTPARQSKPAINSLDYITLTRFAAQQLYAPQRLLKTLPQIQRSRVRQRAVTHLLRGVQVEAIPIAAWRKGRLFVTAVRLVNQTQHPITLDPRDLRGRWRTAAFQHSRLKANGSSADTTVLYLVSDQTFEEAW